jgi:NitT/TauT family transport system substrate-binding protein
MPGTTTSTITRRTAIAAGLGTLALAGCGTSGSPGAGPVEKPDLTVAVVPAITNLGLFLAQTSGFFAAEGLRVKIVNIVSSSTAIAEQRRGTIDVTAGAYVSYIQAQATGGGAVAWHILSEGSLSQQSSQQILIAGDSPVQSLDDLRMGSVGVNIVGNIATLLVDSALASHNIPVTAVHQKAVPFPHMALALKEGRIVAGWFDEPFLSEAQATIGAQSLYDTGQQPTQEFPISGYIATKAWTRRYPRTAQAFVRAITQGQLLADSSRPATEQAMTHFITGLSAEIASMVTVDSYPVGVDPVRIQRVADVMHEFGLLQRPFDTSVMIA